MVNLINPKTYFIITETRKRLLIGEEFYASENQNSEPLSDQISESGKIVSNEKSVTNLNSDTFVNGKKSLNSKPSSTLAITEVVNVPKSDLSETLARYQAKFGPIPTILTGRNLFTIDMCIFFNTNYFSDVNILLISELNYDNAILKLVQDNSVCMKYGSRNLFMFGVK